MTPEFLHRAKILIIDDEITNVRLLEKILARDGYTNVSMTTDARHALTMFRENEPDLILLDLYMPHINGFEVMNLIGDLLPDSTFLPIIVLTADTSIKTRHNALDNGATDFLCKPFDNLEVTLRIRNALRTRFLYRELKNQNQILLDVFPRRTRITAELPADGYMLETASPQAS
jgi:PleD family two-component response regulator